MRTRATSDRPRAWRALGALFLAAAALAAVPLGGARAGYPDHAVTIVACFPPGGGTDVAMRLISNQLGEALGQPVIVENRAGAGGSLGTAYVGRAPADGYTLLGCSSAFVVNPSLYASVTYDPIRDFTPIMVLGSSPNVFVVPGQSKYKTMSELIAAAKANPGKLNWTSPGLGTTPQLAGELLKTAAGIDMVHIPFTGAAPATTAALAGQVDMYAANLGSVTSVLDRMRALAVTAEKRWPDLPDVPTIHELGLNMPDTDTFQALFAPAGTPQPIVERLAKELAAILARPDVREKFAKIGLPVVAEGPAAFGARIDIEVPMYKEVIDKAGLKVQ